MLNLLYIVILVMVFILLCNYNERSHFINRYFLTRRRIITTKSRRPDPARCRDRSRQGRAGAALARLLRAMTRRWRTGCRADATGPRAPRRAARLDSARDGCHVLSLIKISICRNKLLKRLGRFIECCGIVVSLKILLKL